LDYTCTTGTVLPVGWNDVVRKLLSVAPTERMGLPLDKTLPGYESINVNEKPAFLPPEPAWVQEEKKTPMKNGTQGWSLFAL